MDKEKLEAHDAQREIAAELLEAKNSLLTLKGIVAGGKDKFTANNHNDVLYKHEKGSDRSDYTNSGNQPQRK